MDGRDNNFSFIRLLLAGLVLLSHSPELKDGNRHREILTRLFHTVSFGEVAVTGFFLLSGYLIVQSWQHNPNIFDFLKKRALRIYPGFIVASIVCVFVVGPLGATVASDYLSQFNFLRLIKNIVLLRSPDSPPIFQGHPWPHLNGSMWTIAYEFRCYLLVALLGLMGVIRQRKLWLVISALLLLLLLIPYQIHNFPFKGSGLLLGEPSTSLRFAAFFVMGGCAYLFRDKIAYTRKGGIIAAPLLILCLFRNPLAYFALATFGAYLFFWFAFAKIPLLDRFKSYSDISYGVYLYGWPLQKLLLWYIPGLSPWLLFVLALAFSGVCGLLSWRFVERPALRFKGKQAAPAAASNKAPNPQ